MKKPENLSLSKCWRFPEVIWEGHRACPEDPNEWDMHGEISYYRMVRTREV